MSARNRNSPNSPNSRRMMLFEILDDRPDYRATRDQVDNYQDNYFYNRDPNHKWELLDRVKKAVSMGASVNVKDDKGNTPLYYALEKGDEYIPVIMFLVENGADLEDVGTTWVTDSDRLSAINLVLMFSERKNYHGDHEPDYDITLDYILQNGADPNKMDKRGALPLFVAATSKVNRNYKIRKLLYYSADPLLEEYDSVLDEYFSFYRYVEEYGLDELMDILEEHEMEGGGSKKAAK